MGECKPVRLLPGTWGGGGVLFWSFCCRTRSWSFISLSSLAAACCAADFSQWNKLQQCMAEPLASFFVTCSTSKTGNSPLSTQLHNCTTAILNSYIHIHTTVNYGCSSTIHNLVIEKDTRPCSMFSLSNNFSFHKAYGCNHLVNCTSKMHSLP